MDKARSFRLLQLPVVDAQGRLVDVLLREEIPSAPLPKPRAIIMAGGFGRRLHALTHNTPKPMLPVGGRPLLERIIERVKDVGITDVTLTTHYLPDVIKDYFGDGSAFGVQISYVHEDEPLGTAGALTLLPEPNINDAPLLVMNGDILSDIDLACMARQHYMKGAAITVATRQYEMQVPYGVIAVNARGQVKELIEKPTHSFQVSAGIYLLEPNVLSSLPKGAVIQMPDVITGTLDKGFRVDSFIIHEEWLDIGQEHDYHRAQELIKTIGK